MDPIVKELEDSQKKSIEALKNNFLSVRTGRASPALLDRVQVNYYGSPVPLKQLASINAPEPRLLVIQPFDKNCSKDIEKAIMEADLGLNPQSGGGVIRVPVPPLTEERRRELVKAVKKYAEDGKISVRNNRRDIMDLIKADKAKLSEDAVRTKEEEIQKITDKYTQEIDKLCSEKEKEVMEI